MTFQFHQIDRISDIDEAMETLETDYLPALMEVFANSPEGQAYLAAHPEEVEEGFGEWASTFVSFAYDYLGVTLPKLQKRDAETVLLKLFPSKISISPPEQADSIVPELIAFWQFIQREYRQRHSAKILTLLHKIQPTFSQTMNDPNNFGFAKAFMMSGEASGFDMTTPEGVAAYQEVYNQRIREQPDQFHNMPTLGNASPLGGLLFGSADPSEMFTDALSRNVPPEFVALMSQRMGFGPVPGLEHMPTDPEQLITAIAKHLVDTGEVTLTGAENDDEFSSFPISLQKDTLQRAIEKHNVELSDRAIALLQSQTITPSTPGTIVQDMDTLLEIMGNSPMGPGLAVSGKLQHFTLSILKDLNAQLSHPIQTDLKRPQQKSYPNLHGLYLLLRVTGLAEMSSVGKTTFLVRNAERYAAWQTLNPTEKYFTLLEAWLIRGDDELLGEDRSILNAGSRVLGSWPDLLAEQKHYRNYGEQDRLNYWPGFYNLILMQLFGWVELDCPKPDAGKGWRVQQVKPLPIGDAIATVVLRAYQEHDLVWASQHDYTQPWGELQPYFQLYFPEWQHNLPSFQSIAPQSGTYIFKVSLGKIWRRISISSDSTLDALGALIRKSVNFDSDHLDMFSFRNAMGRTMEIHHPFNDWRQGHTTDKVTVGELTLQPGMSMTYLFDFGDNWEFAVQLEDIQPGKPKRNSNKILESHGKSPEQYPDWNE